MPIRSPVLIIDKETKQPKWPEHLGNGRKWWVVLYSFDRNLHKVKRFKSFKKARKFTVALREKFPPDRDYEVTLVSKGIGYGPPRSKVSDGALYLINLSGKLWCPYCRKFRAFDWDPTWGWERCPVCKIPDHDFHVQKNNPHFWPLDAEGFQLLEEEGNDERRRRNGKAS